MAELAVYDNDPTLYLFTSLTAGSSHIITATSRIETILKANKIAFKGVDTATDELAKKLFQRRARGKKLPLLVKEGFVIADLDQVEEWNEYDELQEALGAPAVPAPAIAVPLAASKTPSAPSASAAVGASAKENAPTQTPEQNLAIRQLGAEAAKVAAAKKHVPTKIATTNPLLVAKASPGVGTPTKAQVGSPGGILSPRSIPLPGTPGVAAPGGILSPRSIPLPGTPVCAGQVVSEFHGRKVESPGAEEIKMVEEEMAIREVSSSEEEDSEDEDEEEDEEEEDEEEEEEEEEEDDDDDEDSEDSDEDEEEEEVAKPTAPAKDAAKPATQVAAKDAPTPDAKAPTEKADDPTPIPTPAQPAKAADKAGVSVED